MSDVETRIQQIAQVLGQLDDTQVPRNIRASAKDAVDQWLLNKGKDMDVRLGMTASKLDEIFNDANLLEDFLTEVKTQISNPKLLDKLPDVPKQSDLNIEDLMDCDFFFS